MHDRELLERVEAMSAREIDGLPVGAITMGLDGKIPRNNRTEAEMARLDRKSQVGRNCFTSPSFEVRDGMISTRSTPACRSESALFEQHLRPRSQERGLYYRTPRAEYEALFEEEAVVPHTHSLGARRRSSFRS